LKLRVHVEVMTPFGDLVGAVGYAIDDGHGDFLTAARVTD
jgi:hypothetical protein